MSDGPEYRTLQHVDEDGVERLAVLTFRNPDPEGPDIKAIMEAEGWHFVEWNSIPVVSKLKGGVVRKTPGPFMLYVFERAASARFTLPKDA